MRSLVTGAGGFIGRHLVNHLSAMPGEVFTICLTKAGEHAKARHFQVDLMNDEDACRALADIKPDKVFHLAGASRITKEISFSQYFSANYLSTVSLLEAIKKNNKPISLFFASSVHVYGNPQEIVSETSAVHPLGPYGFSKYLAEQALKNWSEEARHSKVIVGRLYNCIGPGQGEGFVASDLCHKVIRLLNSDENVLETGPLSPYRRFIDVRDAVAIISQLTAFTTGNFEIFNIAPEYELQIKEIVEILLRYTALSPRIESLGTVSPNEFHGLRLSTEKLKKAVSFNFRPVEDTLKDMLAWTMAQYAPIKSKARR